MIMNKKYFLGFYTLFILSCISFIISCEDQGESKIGEYNSNIPIVLTSFHPQSGKITDKVLLDGENFGADASKIKVYFNKKQAAVISSNGNRIYTVVPRLPGDTCTISVVVGNDSVCYEQTFEYHSAALVTTITGNGKVAYTAGTLAEASIQARFLCVDAENNIFASIRDNNFWGVVKINEAENSVTSLSMYAGAQADAAIVPNAPCANFETSIITVPHDLIKEAYMTFDPKEAWAPRIHNMKLSAEESRQIPDDSRWKTAMAYCDYDGYIYTRYRSGHVAKIDPKTYESEIIFNTTAGTSYGLAFHPLKPWLLYFSFYSNAGVNANGISVLDVRDPQAPGAFWRINNPSTAAGHRDGPLETAQFRNPWQLFFDPEGYLYIADADNHCIRRISPADMVETVVGMPGTAGMLDGGKEDALFNSPRGIAVGLDGTIYISDYNNARIRKLIIE
jgi:hypothetical protein